MKDPSRKSRLAGRPIGLAALGPEASWLVGEYMPLVARYYASLREHPNPRPANITDFSEP